MSYTRFAPNQEYTKEYLQRLKEEDLVIYDGHACHAVRIIPRGPKNPLFEILAEDDGFLFSVKNDLTFDLYWADGLIKQLQDAKEYWEQVKDKYLEIYPPQLTM